MVNSDCVFCSRQAVTKNPQGFSACVAHKEEDLPEMKCACGEVLSVKESKYGAFFLCMDCGPVSLKKALSMNEVQPTQKASSPREITLTSDEVDFLIKNYNISAITLHHLQY